MTSKNIENKSGNTKQSNSELIIESAGLPVIELLKGDRNGDTVAHDMAMEGHEFTFNELQKLGNPRGSKGKTIAHLMAERGHKFTFTELFKTRESGG